MKNKIFILFVLIVSSSIGFAQNKNNLFDFDFAQFAYDSTSNYLELYYTVYQNKLTQISTDSGNFVEANLKISIIDTSTNKAVVNKEWLLNYPVNTLDSSKNEDLIGQLLFLLPSGTYHCNVELVDKLKTQNKKSFTDKIHVHPFYEDKLTLSDIELASRIIPNSTNQNSIFYKNTFEITPAPTEVFGMNLPVLFYYYEIYDLQKNDKAINYKLDNVVYNSNGKVLFNKSIELNNNIPSRAEVGLVKINKYPTGSYVLQVSIQDSVNKISHSTLKKFFVFNPGVVDSDMIVQKNSGLISTAFGTMTDEECDDLFKKCTYIATTTEVNQFKKINNLEGKREFLYQFWKKRDEDASSPESVNYQTYLKRIAESNNKFGSFKKQGWQTDRGRVLMMYGEPSEIDRYPNQQDTKPYEIWHYNDIEGGVVFIFADLTGFSDYQLISSTKRGEIQDDNWQARISTN